MAQGSGLSGADQAAIINAVKQAYFDEVVHVEAQRRANRHEQLKGIGEKYAAILKGKRETVRKLSETVGGGEHLLDPKKDVLHRLSYDLRTRRLQLRLERAEAETLLERRKKADGSASEPARKEIAALDDRLAVLKASQTVIDEEFERLTHEMHQTAIRELELKHLKEEISLMEDTARKIGAEVEALHIEIQAPPRIRPIDDAAPPVR
jgi:chromosome segregation ATPase